jgi:hypothetical protein
MCYQHFAIQLLLAEAIQHYMLPCSYLLIRNIVKQTGNAIVQIAYSAASEKNVPSSTCLHLSIKP